MVKNKKFFSDELVKGSLILFVMINIFNLLNYIFHFSMARMLGPADYLVLAVLMNIAYIFGIPAEGLQTLISRYTSKFNTRKKFGKIKYLLIKGLKKSSLISLVLFIIYLPISFLISYLIKIDVKLIIFTGILLFSYFLIPVTRGVMQGRKKFKLLGFNMIIESLFKLVIAVIFVLFGLKVYGAVGGIILGIFISLFFSFYSIKEITNSKIKKANNLKVYSYSFPFMLVMLAVFLVAVLDVFLAAKFFPQEIAGKYAVASTLGKIIFFGTFAISKAMFPLTSEKFDKGKKTKKLFKKAFLIVSVICFIVLLIYGFFPEGIIKLLFGYKYIEISGILLFVGLSFSFLSLSNLSLIYSLSVNKKRSWWFLIFVFLEFILLMIFHETLLQFSLALLTINFIMFLASLIFALKENKK